MGQKPGFAGAAGMVALKPVVTVVRSFGKAERRVFCRCELCRLRFGRMLYPKLGGMPLGWGRLPGFSGNFRRRWRHRGRR